MTSLQDILTAAKSLPSTEQAHLLAALWDGMSPDDWVVPSDAWIAEANRRSDAYDEGKSPGESWPVVRERARREAGLDD